MTRNKAFEHLYGFYLYMHHHRISLQEMADFEKEEWEKMGKDLEVLEILKKRMNIEIPYGSVNVISACNGDDYLLFEVELEEHTKIEEWLENAI